MDARSLATHLIKDILTLFHHVFNIVSTNPRVLGMTIAKVFTNLMLRMTLATVILDTKPVKSLSIVIPNTKPVKTLATVIPSILRLVKNMLRMKHKISKLHFIKCVARDLPLTISFILLTACGFHLRGELVIPPELRVVQILPGTPFDPYQKYLRQALKTNEVQVVMPGEEGCKTALILTLLTQNITERTLGYGGDGQTNRVMMQMTITYQLSKPNGEILIPPSSVQSERELSINPSAVLSTDLEREHIRQDLYIDVSAQLMRQLSISLAEKGDLPPCPPPKGGERSTAPQKSG